MRDLDLLKHPDGSKKHPASTCKELHMSYPNLESGKIPCTPCLNRPLYLSGHMFLMSQLMA